MQQCKRFAPDAKFKITLPEEASLHDAVRWMSSITCVRFIVDAKVRGGKVTVLSPEPVNLKQAYNAFHSALQIMGLAVVPAGSYHKIVEAKDVVGHPVPVVRPGTRPPATSPFVTQLYRTKGDDPAGLAAVLGNFKSKNGSVLVVDEMVILTDTGANIRRMLQIAAAVDKPTAKKKQRVFFIQLDNADPEETARIVREVFQGTEAPKSKSKR